MKSLGSHQRGWKRERLPSGYVLRSSDGSKGAACVILVVQQPHGLTQSVHLHCCSLVQKRVQVLRHETGEAHASIGHRELWDQHGVAFMIIVKPKTLLPPCHTLVVFQLDREENIFLML